MFPLYQLSETRGETLYLFLYSMCHVRFTSIGNVTVRPGCMLAFRSSHLIEKARLGNEYKRSFRGSSLPDLTFRSHYLFKSSSAMESSGLLAGLILPWYWAVKGPIHFENTRSVAVSLEALTIIGWKTVSNNSIRVTWRHIKKDNLGLGQILY